MTDTTNEIKRLRDGLSAIVRCQRAIPRSAIREACAEILNGHTTHMLDQSVFIERLRSENAALRTRRAEAEKVIEPFANGRIDVSHTAVVGVTPEDLHAARTWKEASNA